MDEGSDEVASDYEWEGKTYQLEESSTRRWSVYDGDLLLGTVVKVDPDDGPDEEEPWPHFHAQLPGEETEPAGELSDDWRAALENLLEATSPE